MNDRRLLISVFPPWCVRVLRSDSSLTLALPLFFGLVLILGLFLFRASAGELIWREAHWAGGALFLDPDPFLALEIGNYCRRHDPDVIRSQNS